MPIETVIADYVKNEQSRVELEMKQKNMNINNSNNNNNNTNNNTMNTLINYNKSMITNNTGFALNQSEIQLNQTMNSLDLTSLCLSKTHSFTLFEHVTNLFDRCSNRLQISGNGILRKSKESNYGFYKMRDFLVAESKRDKYSWLNNDCIFIFISIDANTTRKSPGLTIISKLCLLFILSFVVFCFGF